MFTADEVFYKEFMDMMKYRKSVIENRLIQSGNYNELEMLKNIILPDEFANYTIETYDKLYITDIEDEIFSQLNNTEVLWWTKGQLTRRKFDYKGEFMKNEHGDYILEDVDTPMDCVGVISDINVHMPNKYKSKTGDTFDYVDMLEREFDGKTQRKYIYLIPRKNCHKMYQTALLLTFKKPKTFYMSFALSFTNGFTIYLASVPYKPTKPPIGRILRTKTTDNFLVEMGQLREYWVDKGVMFDPNKCILNETVKGRDNMAVLEMPGTVEFTEQYDAETTLERNTENLMTSDFSMAESEDE